MSENAKKIKKLLFDVVAVEMEPQPEKSEGGIILPDSETEEMDWGRVVAVGPKCQELKVGDRVCINENNGVWGHEFGVPLVFIHENHIDGVEI